MKRAALIVLAVLLIAGTVQAQNKAAAEIYGALRYSFNTIDDAASDGLQARGNLSWLGLRGEWGKPGLTVFFNLQFEAFSDVNAGGSPFKQRFYFGGLRGKFGRIAFGRMSNAYKAVSYASDPFYFYSKINLAGGYAAYGGSYGLAGPANGFTDNTLQYSTPVFGGVQLTGSISIDDSDADDHGYVAGASFSIKGIKVGVIGAMNGETAATIPGMDPNGEAIRGYMSYGNKRVKVAFSFENIDTGGMNSNFAFGSVFLNLEKIRTSFLASAGMVNSGAQEGFGGSVGAIFALLQNANLVGIISYADLESGNSPFVFSIGADYNFNLGLTGN